MSGRLERRQFLGGVTFLAATAAFSRLSAGAAGATRTRPPNFIIIFCDNLGYGDIGCFGSKRNRTPHIDRLASEGTRFTSFYVTSGVCTPSRASLMTGCYAQRVGLLVNSRGGVQTPLVT